MDTTPIPHPISAGFMSNPSSSLPAPSVQLMKSSSVTAAFTNMANNPNGSATTICVPALSEMVPGFLNSMEDMEPTQHIRAGPPGFLTDLPTFDPLPAVPPIEHGMNLELSSEGQSSSVSPPALSQVPSPSIHGSASSYSAGVTSSLESALDPPNVASHHRNRTNTSVSPGTTPTSFLNASPPGHQPMGMSFTTPEIVSGKQEDSTEVKTQSILVNMLSESVVFRSLRVI
jgi:hypothetical protein